ncbi:MAG: ComF family protein [bacterium]|nr:ComF family protein [bacterium]
MSWLCKIVDIFYPRFCYHCGRMGEFLCDQGYNELNFLTAPIKLTLPTVYLDQAQALLAYEPLVAKMIHQYKYNGVRDLSATFAFWLYQFLPLPEVDALTYIPLHRKRLQERGYNQARLIASALAQKLALPCLPALKRTIYRDKQALSKNAAERLTKSAHIFAPQNAAIWSKKYPRILIIDDVLTTGATLNEAARILKENGFAKVYGVALAHSD